MRLLYQSLSYVPSRRASSVHVMKMCAAFARAGHDLALTTKFARSRQEGDVEDDFAFYGVAPSFAIHKLPRPAWKGGGLVHLWHSRRMASRSLPLDLIYSRDLAVAVATSNLGVPLVYEAHGPPTGRWSRRMHRQLFDSPNLRRLVVISEALKRLFSLSGLLPQDLDVLVAHDAADFLPENSASEPPPSADLFPPEMRHIGYVGHLYAGRGVALIVALASQMPNYCFHLVGGAAADLERHRASGVPSNLRFHGFVPPAHLPRLFRAFDVLLAPYQRRVVVAGGRTDTSSWMSPMKIFEYMAAGKPIICSDLPVLREVLRNGENALLVQTDQVDQWREALETLTASPETAERLARAALADFASHHTWDQRAAQVLDGLFRETENG